MTAHTPGPWDASAPDGSYHDVIRVFAQSDPEGSLPVAVCPQRKSPIMEVLAGSTNETTEAAFNATLIAAAPELLEVAEQLSSFVAVMFGDGPNAVIPEKINSPLGPEISIGEIMRNARAATGKATGAA